MRCYFMRDERLLLLVLLGLFLGGCDPPADPAGRFDWVKVGMPRERVEAYYGPPRSSVIFFPGGDAFFTEGKLNDTSGLWSYFKKPKWPVRNGMSPKEVIAIVGQPTNEWVYYGPHGPAFEYQNDRLVEKVAQITPPID